MLFGAGKDLVAQNLSITIPGVVDGFFDFIWKMLPQFKRWQTKKMKYYRETFTSVAKSGKIRRGILKTEVINHIIQSSAAQICLMALNKITKESYKRKDYDLLPIGQIHDQIVWEMKDDRNLKEKIEYVKDVMENPPFEWAQNVPFKVDVEIGNNFGELHEQI